MVSKTFLVFKKKKSLDLLGLLPWEKRYKKFSLMCILTFPVTRGCLVTSDGSNSDQPAFSLQQTYNLGLFVPALIL